MPTDYRFIARTALRVSGGSLEKASTSGAVAAIFVFCGGLFLCTILAYGNDLLAGLAHHGLQSGTIRTLPIIIVLCCGLIALARHGPLPPAFFVPTISAVSLLLYGIYAQSLETPWVSDFLRMWTEAGRLVEEGRFAADGIIQQRTLPVLWPTVYLFGHDPVVVPIVNALFLVSIQLLGYDILRRVHGHLSAQIFALLWLGAAEPIFSLKIPTHDLWGLFFAVLVLWSLVLVLRRRRSSVLDLAYGALIGIPVILLEVQRELGLVALAAIATATLIMARNREQNGNGRHGQRRRLLCLLVGASLVFMLGTYGLKSVGIITTDDSYTYLSNVRTAGLAPSYSDGTFRYARTFGNAFVKPLEIEAQRETARSLFLSDFAEQPIVRLSGVAFKTSRLALLGSQYGFYLSELRSQSPKLLDTLSTYNKMYALLIALLFLRALIPTLALRADIATVFSLAFLGVLIGGLVTVGEIQPRYVFPLWFFAPLVIATYLGRADAMSNTPLSLVTFSGSILLGVLVGAVALGAAHWMLNRTYTPADGKVVTQFALTSTGVEPIKHVPPRHVDHLVRNNRSLGIGDLGFTLYAGSLTTAPSNIKATSYVCAGQEHISLRFSYVMPYTNPQASDAFRLSVSFDGHTLWTHSLPDDGNFHNVKLSNIATPGQCGELQYKLEIRWPLRRDSWVAASRTEVYFPRLTRY